MNSWPGPENSWEGVDAYFTWANSPVLLTTFVIIVVAICVGVIWAASRHEKEVADKH